MNFIFAVLVGVMDAGLVTETLAGRSVTVIVTAWVMPASRVRVRFVDTLSPAAAVPESESIDEEKLKGSGSSENSGLDIPAKRINAAKKPRIFRLFIFISSGSLWDFRIMLY